MSSSDSEPNAASAATLAALELPALLRLVAELTATDAGRRLALALEPVTSEERLTRRRLRFEEARRLLGGGALVAGFEEPLLPLVEALAEGRESVTGEDLVLVASLLQGVVRALELVRGADPECPELAALADGLDDPAPLVKRIRRTLDRRGRVRDDASPALAKLTSTARRTRDALYSQLRDYAGRHEEELSEETVPLHRGRLVVKLRAGAKGRVRGLVHGRSSTGKSLYFEPLAVVDANNTLQETRGRQEEERRRLLVDLIRAVRAEAATIDASAEFLARLDLIQATVRFGERADARLAELSTPGELRLVEARHPLLDPRLAPLRRQALGHAGHTAEAEPLDLELEPDRRTLVITGPNAGGKTVALKTVGLLALMNQCGLPLPAAAGSRLPLFAAIVASVGDEQDLLEDRSTFSGRLLRLQETWSAAGARSLLLVDELGSGTDPAEGAALAIALVERMLAARSLAVITTHLTELAAMALESEGAACAAMEFDAATGRPTYRLVAGAPGASEAIALARRLGLPEEWLARAEELLGPEQLEFRRLLAEVEATRDELARETREARREAERLAAESRRLEESHERLEEERRALAPKQRAELAEFRRQVNARLRDEVELLRGEVRKGRRKGLERQAAERLFRDAPEPQVDEPEGPEPSVGARVEHRGLGWTGTVEALGEKRATVQVRGKRLHCAPDELRVVAAAQSGERARRPGVEVVADDEPGRELHLIGQRVEPALETLDGYLDRALLAAHAEVRVIHGHGSGRLRRAVREHLRGHPAVASSRPGRADEGGDGATVVVLRD